MAFDITLQINRSERKQLTKNITNVITVSGELKSETSIINPIIIIECGLESVKNCNYMSIPVFGRSYFITDIRSIRNGFIEFSGHSDVLSSFASEIRNNTAIIHKQANKWNLYLNDGTFKVYQNSRVLTKAFPSGFSTQEFVLALASK